MITTNERDLYEKLCDLRSHGMTRDKKRLLRKGEGGWYYEMQQLGFNYRMTDIQAALGIAQMKKLAMFVKRRREIAHQYFEAFQGLEGVKLVRERRDCLNSHHLFVLQLELSKFKHSRQEIFDQLKERGLGLQVHYIPVPRQPFYRSMGYQAQNFPVAEAYYESVFSLPLFPKMTSKETAYVIRQVTSVIQGSLR